MLNTSYVVIGIGRAYNASSTYGWYWTTDFGGFLDPTISQNPTPSPAPVVAPTIASFTATPSSTAAGTSVVLSWNVTGASTITLDNGIGDVSTLTSKTVSPAQTTTYTLTATNSGGSTTAHVTVTVIVPPPLQPPTAPVSTNEISIWPGSVTPQFATMAAYRSVEVGVKFRSDVSGTIDGIRFFKGAANIGVHTGSLWTSTGQLLATGTFTNESSSGWQILLFSSPVPIAANTTYVASYFSPGGFFAASLQFFNTQGVNNGPLHALQAGVDGPNGVMIYGPGGQYPADNAYGDNFWVDVLFRP